MQAVTGTETRPSFARSCHIPISLSTRRVAAREPKYRDRSSDTVVGAAVLDLMAQLRRELGVSYLFHQPRPAHVRSVRDEIVVMQHGCKLAQVARSDFERGPHHPYYELLARSVPELGRGGLDECRRLRGLNPTEDRRP